MGRVIQSEIKRPLADALLFGDLQQGGVVKVDVVEDKIKIDVVPA